MRKALLVLAVMVLCVGCVKAETKFYPKNDYRIGEWMVQLGIGCYGGEGMSVNEALWMLKQQIKGINERMANPKEYIGEYCEMWFPKDPAYPYPIPPEFDWNKFTKDDIDDEVDGYVKIDDKWYGKKDIIWYEDRYKSQKAIIEQRIKTKEKVIK